jgi:hypothetical protein
MDASRHRLALDCGLGLAFSVLDAWFYSVSYAGVVRKALLQRPFNNYAILLEVLLIKDLVPSAAGLCWVGLGLKAVSTSCRVGALLGLILERELADVQARALASPLVILAFACAVATADSARCTECSRRGSSEAVQ